jgi:hypothetical protein
VLNEIIHESRWNKKVSSICEEREILPEFAPSKLSQVFFLVATGLSGLVKVARAGVLLTVKKTSV